MNTIILISLCVFLVFQFGVATGIIFTVRRMGKRKPTVDRPVNATKMSVEEYRWIREHHPELLGL